MPDQDKKSWIAYKKAFNGIKLGDLPVGSLVKDVNSTFYSAPIVWKVADINHAGYPENSVTLITNQSIALGAFDAKEPSNSSWWEQTKGNSRYHLSNIRQWINSDAPAGQWYKAQHSVDASPASGRVDGNAYSSRVGFLNGFSEGFKNAILDTTIVVAKVSNDGGGTMTLTDKMFLASNTEVGLANEKGVVEGKRLALFSNDASRQTTLTSEASKVNSANGYNGWWMLRTPYTLNCYQSRLVNNKGAISFNPCYMGYFGARPLCNLPSSTLVSFQPDTDGCYVINHFI